MALTNNGRNRMAGLITGSLDQASYGFGNTRAWIGVGNSTTAFDVTQGNLQAAVNRLFKAMVAGYPTTVDNVMTFRSLFGTSDANYAWAEWGVSSGAVGDPAAGACLLCRKVEALGTKASTQSWQITVTISVLVGA